MLPNLIPGIVASYDKNKRLCRVEIPGITDGADVLPEAEFCNPIGDKSEHTEIRILPGDRVWLAFAGGDPRYPVIMGFRPKNSGNSTDWRRWHHANIEANADGELLLKAGVKVHVVAPEVFVDSPQSTFTGKVTVQGLLTYQSGMAGSGGSGAAAQITGQVQISGGDVIADGIGLKSHHHTEQGDGAPTSAAQS